MDACSRNDSPQKLLMRGLKRRGLEASKLNFIVKVALRPIAMKRPTPKPLNPILRL